MRHPSRSSCSRSDPASRSCSHHLSPAPIRGPGFYITVLTVITGNLQVYPPVFIPACLAVFRRIPPRLIYQRFQRFRKSQKAARTDQIFQIFTRYLTEKPPFLQIRKPAFQLL